MRSRVLVLMVVLALGWLPTALAQSNKDKARAFYEQILGQGKVELARDMFSPDAVHHDPTAPGGQWPKGPDLARTLVGVFRTAFPDLSFKILAQYEEGDFVTTHWQATGTHNGPLNGIPASGKKMSVTGMNITRYQNGKAVEDWTNWDFYGLLAQIGAVPPPGPPK